MVRTSLAVTKDVLVTELEWWSTVHLTGDGDTQRLANLLTCCFGAVTKKINLKGKTLFDLRVLKLLVRSLLVWYLCGFDELIHHVGTYV